MDLKFTFGGASPDQHDHGGAPSGISLPISARPVALGPQSSTLEISVRRHDSGLMGEAISGDGVTYSSAEVSLGTNTDDDAAAMDALVRAVKSAISRAVAGLEGPLAESVTGLVIDLGDESASVLAAMGLDSTTPVVDAALQRRAGVSMGTPVRIAGA